MAPASGGAAGESSAAAARHSSATRFWTRMPVPAGCEGDGSERSGPESAGMASLACPPAPRISATGSGAALSGPLEDSTSTAAASNRGCGVSPDWRGAAGTAWMSRAHAADSGAIPAARAAAASCGRRALDRAGRPFSREVGREAGACDDEFARAGSSRGTRSAIRSGNRGVPVGAIAAAAARGGASAGARDASGKAAEARACTDRSHADGGPKRKPAFSVGWVRKPCQDFVAPRRVTNF